MNFKNKSISPCGSFWDDFFKKKHREVSESFIKQLGKKHKIVFPSFFLEHQKNLGSRKGPWRDVCKEESMDPNPWLLVHLFEFQPTGRVSHHAEKISFDLSIHDPGGGKKWWLISAVWTAAVGILGFCKRGFWGKSSDSPGLVRFCKYTICI